MREDASRTGQHGLECRALAHDLSKGLDTGVGRRFPGAAQYLAPPLQRRGQGIAQRLDVLGQGEVVTRAVRDQLGGDPATGVRSHHDHGDLRRGLVPVQPVECLALRPTGRHHHRCHLGTHTAQLLTRTAYDIGPQIGRELRPQLGERIREFHHNEGCPMQARPPSWYKGPHSCHPRSGARDRPMDPLARIEPADTGPFQEAPPRRFHATH